MTSQPQGTEPLQAAPARVGRYHLVRSLGEGGMGQVHRARAYGAAGVTKDLCIKRIREERLRREGAAERFIAEARLSMRLTHGNIVPVFDFGRAGHEYFLAMEWVDGADLKTLLRDAKEGGEPMRPEVVAHVGAEVARALAYAHGLDGPDGEAVVHRDVKPANILVSCAGDVKLTDFGVATVVGDSGGGVGGTPAYMAPEQSRGAVVDGRADLYALGVTLAEMLTGDRDVGALAGATAPGSLIDLVRALLAEDPAERPDDAQGVAAELERVVGRARAEGAPAPRDDLAERARRCARAARESRDEADLDVDTSFALDGKRRDFAVRMGATAVTASAIASPPGAQPRAAPTRGKRVARWVLAVGLVGAAVTAWWIARPNDTRHAGPVSAGANVPSEPVASPSTPPASDQPQAEAPTDESQTERSAEVPADDSQPAPPRDSARPSPHAVARPPATHRHARSVEPSAAPSSEPAPAPGRLNVNALPWAEVRIDGRVVGTTPLFGIELPAGEHTVRFDNPHLGAEHETRVTLAPGDSRDLVVDLQ